MNTLKIYFAGVRRDVRPIDLASALRVGGHEPQHGASGPEYGKYEQLNINAANFFQSVPIEQAELVINANQARHSPEVLGTARLAQKRDLPCFFFSWGDVDEPISVPHGIVYRHSMFSDTRLGHERALPAFCSDLVEESKQPYAPREKKGKPLVGFCGYVDRWGKRLAFRLLGHGQKAEGLNLRAHALKILENSSRVKTNFVARFDFWGGTFRAKQFGSAEHYNVRREYLDNVFGSDYTLCVRGAGNFSYRFYETLAAGRIPLFINSRCVLPFEDQIDWRKHCVWLEAENIKSTGDVLADFHEKLTNEQFMEMQVNNRILWLKWLCPLGFYCQALMRADKPNPGASAIVQ